MARLSTGQNIGTTDRRTSQRLVGGQAQMATAGELAGAQLNLPAIRAQADVVNTYQQTGAPTLGGPVRFFEPPAPPRPSQDMAALADALSSFNQNLQGLGTAALQYDKQLEEEAKARGAAAAAKVARFGGFKDYGEAVREVERKATVDPNVTPLLTELRSLDPRAQRYADMEVADALVKQRMATLKDDLANTVKLPDGRALETVAPTDPAFFDYMVSKVLPEGLSPAAIARNQTNLYSLFGSVRADQAKRHADYNDGQVRVGFMRGVSGDLALMQSGQINSQDLALRLSQRLTDLYANSRPSLYKEQKDKLLENLAETAVAVAGGNPAVLDRVAPALAQALEMAVAGPTGTEPLIDQFGKPREAVINDFYRQLMKGVSTDRELQDTRAKYRGEDAADGDVQQYLPPEVLNNPAELQARLDALPQRAVQLFPNDPDAQLAYQSRLRAFASNRAEAYLKPIQEKAFDAEYERQALNPSADPVADIRRYSQMRNSGLISSEQFRSLTSGARARAEKANDRNYDTLRGLQRDLQQRLTEQYKMTTEGDGSPAVSPSEAAEIRQTMGTFYREGEKIILRNPGANVDQQLGTLFQNIAVPVGGKEQGKGTQPLSKSPEDIAKGFGPGRGNPGDNARLRRQAETKPLYSLERMANESGTGQLDQILSGKPLDPATRQIIRRTGMKPSEFFIKQMELHGLPLDPEVQQRLRKLDGSDLVSSARMAGPQVASGGMAQRLWRQWATAVSDAFIPPAAAGTMPMAPPPAALRFDQIPGGRAKLTNLARLAKAAGFSAQEIPTMVAIAMAESGGRATAHNNNRSTGDDSYGLWQINMIDELGPERRRQFGISSNSSLWDPNVNAMAARKVKESQGFGAWTVYRTGAYRSYLPAAQQVVRQVFSSR